MNFGEINKIKNELHEEHDDCILDLWITECVSNHFVDLTEYEFEHTCTIVKNIFQLGEDMSVPSICVELINIMDNYSPFKDGDLTFTKAISWACQILMRNKALEMKRELLGE